MKPSLLALAVLTAFSGVAAAQGVQGVQLTGTIDLNAQAVKNSGSDRRLSMGQDGLNQSQLVFSGREDLGGGLYAGFLLNSGVNADTGTSNAKFWNRGSWVNLGGNFGETRLGRDYVPTFNTLSRFDAFGATGPAAGVQTAQIAVSALGQTNKLVGANAYGQTAQRADNMISYFLPRALGGVYGQFSAAAGEGGGAGGNPGRLIGGRVGYGAGPFDVQAAYQQQEFAPLAGVPTLKTANIGGKYDFGIFRLLGYWDHQTITLANGTDLVENRPSISAVIPVGVAEIHVGYSHSKLNNSKVNASNVISNTGLGLVYNLSKRTALYTNFAYLENGSWSNNSLVIGSAMAAPPTLGGNSSAFQLGVRHFF